MKVNFSSEWVLFGLATLLLGAGLYAAGAWVAAVSGALIAWRTYMSRQADRPETVAELQALREILRKLEISQQFLVTHLTAANPARASPLRSPLRPPGQR